jgi:regulator of protease activity HflC (stomatin/prohibitin superfamily)
MPYIAVSHVVTRRQIPFELPRVEAPTQDNARARIDALLTFVISDPSRFVYTIAAPDFDLVMQAAGQDGVRTLVRTLSWQGVLDIGAEHAEELRARIEDYVRPYGVEIGHLNITYARPDEAFLLAEQAAQAEMRKRVNQIEADAMELRLRRMEELLAQYPHAADWEWQSEQLGVARALATNSHAIVQLGQVSDVLRTMMAVQQQQGNAHAPIPDQARGG